ncbi:hypothetical protein HOY80DRAFT_1033746 [Tuber brumale]|nr:hypothetical protein HOY80DRAFT_1033746 [Tuber brumale]
MPQERRAPRSSNRVRRLSKRARDSVSISFGAMGVGCRSYPVITPRSKDPFPGCLELLPKPLMKNTPTACTEAGIDSDLADMRAHLPKPPIKVAQHSETAGVLKFVQDAFPASTKPLRIILKIPTSGNKITKKPPTSRKWKPLDITKTLGPTEDFKVPATLNRPRMAKAPTASSPEKPKVKELRPLLKRSPRAKNSPKVSH